MLPARYYYSGVPLYGPCPRNNYLPAYRIVNAQLAADPHRWMNQKSTILDALPSQYKMSKIGKIAKVSGTTMMSHTAHAIQ